MIQEPSIVRLAQRVKARTPGPILSDEQFTLELLSALRKKVISKNYYNNNNWSVGLLLGSANLTALQENEHFAQFFDPTTLKRYL